MTEQNRRDFIRMAAGVGGATAAMSLIPEAIARAMTIPANNATGTIMDVEHIVVFMQENRSFDHYLGLLNGVRGFGDPRAIRLPGGRTVWSQPGREHPDGYVMPFHGDSKTTKSYTVHGAEMNHQADLTILNGGRFDRWGETKELHKRMVYYGPSDLPYYYALAGAFTVCDAYHCSTLTQTYPNRLHLWTGCNGGGKTGGDPDMTNYGEDLTPSADMAEDKPLKADAYRWTTYAERLEAAGVSWKVYQEYDNFGDNILSVFPPFRTCAKGSSYYERARSWVGEGKPEPDRTRSDGVQLVEAFRKDLAAGTLPQVSWIVTATDLSEHPDAVPSKGEHVCAELIKALIDHPEMFAKTVFIVNYDENGGFFDHAPPPLPPLRPSEGFSTVPVEGEAKDYGGQAVAHKGQQPVGLGVRVPAIIVSPWSRGGYVCSEVFDHTSVLRFMEKRFGVMEPNISDWRRSICGDLTSAFDFKTPNQDWTKLSLPGTADFLERAARSKAGADLRIPERQAPTAQSSDQRLARPLPYALSASGRVTPAGRFAVTLVNSGTAGASFQVYDNTDAQAPWRYTIGAGDRHVSEQWHDAGSLKRYDLSVVGPDGFFRRFSGDLASPAGAEVDLAHETAAGAVRLSLANTGAVERAFVVELAAPYGGEGRKRVHRIAPGAVVEDRRSVAGSDGWYDLVVTLEGDPSYQRRFAGRVDNGRAGKTDPAIGAMVVTA
jgi:phospholipase C